MKRLSLCILLFIVSTGFTYGQNDLIEAKSITEVYELNGISKTETFSRIVNWFALEENAINQGRSYRS